MALNGFLWTLLDTAAHQCNASGVLSQQTLSLKNLVFISFGILLISAGLVSYQYKRLKPFAVFGWALFLSGSCANMIERVRLGCVRDTLPFFFNIANNPADWSIGIGFFLLLLYYGDWKPYK